MLVVINLLLKAMNLCFEVLHALIPVWLQIVHVPPREVEQG
tara:strand:+ start:228 stop:350 length:123 start_codon:yes stop_codon:yes gene_type:complete